MTSARMAEQQSECSFPACKCKDVSVCEGWIPVARKSLPDRGKKIETGIAGIPFDGESDPEVLERYVALYGDASLLQWRYV